jgi:hypothetical protein
MREQGRLPDARRSDQDYGAADRLAYVARTVRRCFTKTVNATVDERTLDGPAQKIDQRTSRVARSGSADG